MPGTVLRRTPSCFLVYHVAEQPLPPLGEATPFSGSPRSLPGTIVFPAPKRELPFSTELAQAHSGRVKQSLCPWLRSGKTKHRWPHLSRKMGKSVFVCWSQEHLCVCSVEILDLSRLIYILSALSLDIWVGGPVPGGKTVLSTRSQRKDSQFLSQRLVVHRKSTVSKCIQSQYGTWGASKELWGWLSIWEFWAVRMKQNKKRPGFLLPGFSYTPSLWKQPTLSRFQAEKL